MIVFMAFRVIRKVQHSNLKIKSTVFETKKTFIYYSPIINPYKFAKTPFNIIQMERLYNFLCALYKKLWTHTKLRSLTEN